MYTLCTQVPSGHENRRFSCSENTKNRGFYIKKWSFLAQNGHFWPFLSFFGEGVLILKGRSVMPGSITIFWVQKVKNRGPGLYGYLACFLWTPL